MTRMLAIEKKDETEGTHFEAESYGHKKLLL